MSRKVLGVLVLVLGLVLVIVGLVLGQFVAAGVLSALAATQQRARRLLSVVSFGSVVILLRGISK